MTWSPAGTTDSSEQSMCARQPSMRGEPCPGPWLHSTPSNLSSPLPAKIPDSDACASDSTLTTKWPVSSMAGHDVELFPTQNPTSGGSSEIEKNEPTARPTVES